MDKKRWSLIVKLACVVILAALYIVWLAGAGEGKLFVTAASALSVLLFGWMGVNALTAWFEPPIDSIKNRRPEGWRRYVAIALVILAARAAEYVLLYAISTVVDGYNGGIFDRMGAMYVHSDAPHYLGIADNWYVTEGDPRFHIVFLPFFPIVVAAFKLIIGDAFASAMVVNTLAACGAGVMLYKLARLDYDCPTALRILRYQFLLAGAVFLLSPMTEALFLLLSVAAVYLARTKRPLFAALLAALAAFTRSPGLLLIVPLAIETLSNGDKRPLWQRLACLAIVPLGTAAYLVVNRVVTGDALTFMTYQREHWYQSFCFFFNTARVQADNLMGRFVAGDNELVLQLWLPNILAFFGSLAIMIPAARRIRHSYSVYFTVYFAATMGVTWLLSAPRYLFAAFPLAIGLAVLVKKRWLDALVTAALVIVFCIYGYMFVSGSYVY